VAYEGTITVFYGNRLTKLEQLRQIERDYIRFTSAILPSAQLWDEKGGDDLDEHRSACAGVLAAWTDFGISSGLPDYARDRLNDLLVALDELMSGRSPKLLKPASVHAGTLAVADLMQQGIAQVCVDMMRSAGATAEAARKKVSGLFAKHGMPKFGTSKLRELNSRLTGPGSKIDKAYEHFQWASKQAENLIGELGFHAPLSIKQAYQVAEMLIRTARQRDHRRNF
jgi:hypothetical protein